MSKADVRWLRRLLLLSAGRDGNDVSGSPSGELEEERSVRICIYKRGTQWRYTVHVDSRCIRHGPLNIPDTAGQEEAVDAARGKYPGEARIIRVGDMRSEPKRVKRNGQGPHPKTAFN